jgi:hypothetical protein
VEADAARSNKDMRKYQLSLLILALLAAVSLDLAQSSQQGKGGYASTDPHATHVVVTPDQITWGPAPPSLPSGAQLAILEGDPSKAGVPFASGQSSRTATEFRRTGTLPTRGSSSFKAHLGWG